MTNRVLHIQYIAHELYMYIILYICIQYMQLLKINQQQLHRKIAQIIPKKPHNPHNHVRNNHNNQQTNPLTTNLHASIAPQILAYHHQYQQHSVRQQQQQTRHKPYENNKISNIEQSGVHQQIYTFGHIIDGNTIDLTPTQIQVQSKTEVVVKKADAMLTNSHIQRNYNISKNKQNMYSFPRRSSQFSSSNYSSIQSQLKLGAPAYNLWEQNRRAAQIQTQIDGHRQMQKKKQEQKQFGLGVSSSNRIKQKGQGNRQVPVQQQINVSNRSSINTKNNSANQVFDFHNNNFILISQKSRNQPNLKQKEIERQNKQKKTIILQVKHIKQAILRKQKQKMKNSKLSLVSNSPSPESRYKLSKQKSGIKLSSTHANTNINTNANTNVNTNQISSNVNTNANVSAGQIQHVINLNNSLNHSRSYNETLSRQESKLKLAKDFPNTPTKKISLNIHHNNSNVNEINGSYTHNLSTNSAYSPYNNSNSNSNTKNIQKPKCEQDILDSNQITKTNTNAFTDAKKKDISSNRKKLIVLSSNKLHKVQQFKIYNNQPSQNMNEVPLNQSINNAKDKDATNGICTSICMSTSAKKNKRKLITVSLSKQKQRGRLKNIQIQKMDNNRQPRQSAQRYQNTRKTQLHSPKFIKNPAYVHSAMPQLRSEMLSQYSYKYADQLQQRPSFLQKQAYGQQSRKSRQKQQYLCNQIRTICIFD